MAGKTSISWANLSWNIFSGCSRDDESCRNCYAEILTATRMRDVPKYRNLAVIKGDGEAHFTGEVRFDEPLLTWPIRKQEPAFIFTNAMSDTFHPNAKQEWQDAFFAAMLIGNQHIYQVLTKRAKALADFILDTETKERVFKRARKLWKDELAGKQTKANPNGKPFPEECLVWPAPHIWLGTSVGYQKAADKKTPELLRIPEGWLLWWSAEPLIGEIYPREEWFDGSAGNRIRWVVVGGESGTRLRARPMNPLWRETIKLFCSVHEVAFWDKQPGNWRAITSRDEQKQYLRLLANKPDIATGPDYLFVDTDGTSRRGNEMYAVYREAFDAQRYFLTPSQILYWYNDNKEDKDEEPEDREYPPLPTSFAVATMRYTPRGQKSKPTNKEEPKQAALL